MARKTRDWVWVSRDKIGSFQDRIEIWEQEIAPKYTRGVYSGDDCVRVCQAGFVRVTGIKLKPGECRKVRFRAEFVE